MCTLKKSVLNADIFPVLKKIAFLGFLLIIPFFLKARPAVTLSSGKISGIIIDSVDRQPIEYATIALSLHGGNAVINGTTSGPDGKFVLTNISKGNYRIVINFLGYGKKVIDTVILTEKVSSVFLGTILLSPKATNLQGVTITAEKSIIENKIDKMIYNAENDITSQSGVAIDVPERKQ